MENLSPPNLPLPPPVSPKLLPPPLFEDTRLTCLIIPIRIPPSQLRDLDNNPPSRDRRFHHLSNLFKSYQNHSTQNHGQTLIWLNLMRGLLNNSSWLCAWIFLMNRALLNQYQNPLLRNALNNLANWNFLLLPPPRSQNLTQTHNRFPLFPSHPPINSPREPRSPPNPAPPGTSNPRNNPRTKRGSNTCNYP